MCGCTKSINGMKRRKGARRRRRSRMGALPTVSNLTGIVATSATVLGGYAIAGKVKNIGFLANNPLFGNLATIAAGVILPGFLKGAVGTNLGIGMALRGVQGLVVDNVPGVADTLGLSGIPEMNPYYSVVGGFNDPGPMNSIAGASSGMDNIMLRVR